MRELDKESKLEMAAKLQAYFLRERGEELGTLAARLLVDFIAAELGSVFYNQGIFDAHRYFNDRIEELLDLQKY